MLAIAGCSEDNTHPKVSPVDEPSADAVTILATIDAIPSATGDGEAYAPLWQEGDQIVVGYKGISYVYETYDAGNGVEFHPMALSLPADARGEVTAYFKAVDGVFAVGADQTGATLPMYAYAADAAPAQGSLGLHFKPLASVLSLTIGEEASKTISKITLEPVDPDGVEGHLAVSEAVVDPRTGAVTVGEDAAVSDILTMEIGEMSLVQAQTVNFLIVSGTKVDGGLKATISCTDGSVFVKNLFETQEVAFAGNCVGAATELFFRLRIATYEDMVNFAQECADDNGGAIVDLQADIDMRNVPWTPVENFTGTFNGNGHRIYNINVSADGRYAGFFAYAKGAISDVVFGSKDGTSYDGTSRIELKYSADTDTWCYAGIVAQSNNTLTGVTSFVPVTVTADSRCKSRTGGIVGSLYNGKMSGCRNYGAVSNVATAGVASYVAGIAGIVDGSGDAAGAITLDGCHNHGPVMTSLGLGNAVAGITASVMKTAVNTTISNCTNAGEIRFDNAGTSAAHRIGGIVAYIVDSCPTLVIDNCTNKGTVVSNMNGNCFIGGIAGVNYAAAIRDCTNEAEVKFVQANAAGAGYLCIGGISVGDGSQFGGIAEGERMGRIFGYVAERIIETQEEADAARYDTQSRGYRRSDRRQIAGRKDIGDYEWKDRPGSTRMDGRQIINAEDQFLLGYALPHSTGGIGNTFRYRNWTLNVYMDYALGHSVRNDMQMRYFQSTMGNCNYNLVNEVKKCWSQPGDDTRYARFTANDTDWGNRNYGRTSDIFVEKADYLCLRDVSLSWSLPKAWLRKLHISDVTLTVSGNTLCYWTAVHGVSPEAATTGGLYTASSTYDTGFSPYPPTRKVLFTAKLTF